MCMTIPTRTEVDAAEKVLADAHSQPCDGYWRSLASDALEAAKDAQLADTITELDALFGTGDPADGLVEDELERQTGGTRR